MKMTRPKIIALAFAGRSSERNFTIGTKTDSGTPSFWIHRANCIACLYGNQNVDETATC